MILPERRNRNIKENFMLHLHEDKRVGNHVVRTFTHDCLFVLVSQKIRRGAVQRKDSGFAVPVLQSQVNRLDLADGYGQFRLSGRERRKLLGCKGGIFQLLESIGKQGVAVINRSNQVGDGDSPMILKIHLRLFKDRFRLPIPLYREKGQQGVLAVGKKDHVGNKPFKILCQ